MSEVATVSERESEVLLAVADHLTNAEIARRLHISVRTVESHVSSLLRKLGVADRRALARHALGLAGDGPGPAGDAEMERVAEAAPGNGGTRPGALRGAPAALTSFVGRRRELDAVAEALASARLVSLVGPGGVGKTRLAVEAGRRAATHHPAAWFVDLVPVRRDGVATAVAAALGLGDRPNSSLADVIEDALRDDVALLVLDNCEHVQDEAASLIERLLVACPGLRVMATSRELLGVTGERVVPVAPLGEADAVTLFVERASALDPSFGAGRDARVAEVCARLDGIPLAIELASARCAVLGLDGVRAGLTDRLRLLAVRRPDDRHRSLRSVLDWSHDLLGEVERVVLRRLAVFAGDIAATDAAAVVSDGIGDAAAVDAIGQLTAKSLLVRSDAGGTSVFRLLETVHEYALEQLDASGEGDAVRRRHLAWALATAADVEAHLESGDAWRPRFDAVADDVRLALGWATGEPDLATDAHALARLHAHLAYARRFLAEAQAHYEQAATLAPDAPTAARDLSDAAWVAYARMRADLGYRLHLRAAEVAGPHDPPIAATALADAATLAWRCPAEFDDAPPDDELNQLMASARRLDPGTDAAVSAHLLVADAWAVALCPAADPDGPRTGGPDAGPRIPDAVATDHERSAALARSRAAVAAARATADLTLLSCALDAETSALLGLGRAQEAFRLAQDRLQFLDRMPLHDPHTGGEVIDAFHMAADTALTAGRPRAALDAAAAMRRDEVAATAPHAANRETVIAFALMGRFDAAIGDAEAMRSDWERAGRPSAGWMTPAAAAAQLSYALLGDAARAADWKAVTREVAGTNRHSWAKKAFAAFADARIALHEGRIDEAVRAATGWDPAPPNGYLSFVVALDAELAALTGAADAADRLATAHRTVDENAWARACLLRGDARLTGDEVALRGALDLFAEVDARFEWAVTALLAGGATADEGRAVIEALGVTPPA